MQSFRMLSALAALALIVPGAALSAGGQARPEGWRCEAERCVRKAQSDTSRDLLAQCRRTVRIVGPVSHYRQGDRQLGDADLRACNRFVITTQPPRN